MVAIRTVLCSVDFSPATPRQVNVAADVCRAFGARLVLHHNVVGAGVGAAVGWMWTASHPPDSPQSIDKRLRLELARVSARPDRRSAHATEGPVAQTVLTVGEAVGADVVVLSTHGTTTEDHTSITEEVPALRPAGGAGAARRGARAPDPAICERHRRHPGRGRPDGPHARVTRRRGVRRGAGAQAADRAAPAPPAPRELLERPARQSAADDPRSRMAALVPADLVAAYGSTSRTAIRRAASCTRPPRSTRPASSWASTPASRSVAGSPATRRVLSCTRRRVRSGMCLGAQRRRTPKVEGRS